MPPLLGPWFVDTNILLRLATTRQDQFPEIRLAVDRLLNQHQDIFCAAQNIGEFWNVSTRPAEKNGFGLTIPEVRRELDRIEGFLTILPETLEVFEEWKRLVTAHEVRGVQVHDARLAANMRVHGISNLLTLNGADFRRFPGITPVKPADLNSGELT